MLRRSCSPAVPKVWFLPAVDTGSADITSPHTGTSLVLQEPVCTVEKNPEEDLDCRHPVKPAL